MTTPRPQPRITRRARKTAEKYFLPYQVRWLDDNSPLKIIEKSRQIGMTYVDAYDSVLKASRQNRPADVYVSSRDLDTTRLYLEHCKFWAQVLNVAAEDLGEQIIDEKERIKALVLRFTTGFRIHSLSSEPNALVGKHGHIKLDEFAAHGDQSRLYDYALPCTTWGYQLSILSSQRSRDTFFNHLITEIKEKGNPKGFGYHRVTIHDAVAQGLVAKINQKSGRTDSPEQFLQKLRARCRDDEAWLQEYCCVPADDSCVFITFEMIRRCESPNCLRPFSYLESSSCSSSSSDLEQSSTDPSIHSSAADARFYVGVDIGRKHDLTVIDVGEKCSDVMWDRLRLELHNKPFSEIEHELHRILAVPRVRRCCIDATGIGMQLAERAVQRFGYKVEAITFKPEVKERLAYGLKMAFDDRTLRIDTDPVLHADLRGVKKEVGLSGNTRIVSDTDATGHCDRFWAKALRQYAALEKITAGARVL